jgi:hypothetical protein
MNNGSEILGDADIIKHATEYYKGLFGQARVTDFRFEGMDGNQLTKKDRANLRKGFDF